MGGLVGRRTAASEVWLPPGAVPTGVRPPFSFWSCPKRECAAPGGREKGAWARSGAVALRARRGSAYRCKRRFELAFGHARLFCEVATAVPWRRVRRASGCKDAFDQLLFPRVPLRYALAGSSRKRERQRKSAQDVSLTSPGQRSPQGKRVSVPDRRAGQPTIPRRRQEVCAGADRPAEHFFFSTGRGAFSF